MRNTGSICSISGHNTFLIEVKHYIISLDLSGAESQHLLNRGQTNGRVRKILIVSSQHLLNRGQTLLKAYIEAMYAKSGHNTFSS